MIATPVRAAIEAALIEAENELDTTTNVLKHCRTNLHAAVVDQIKAQQRRDEIRLFLDENPGPVAVPGPDRGESVKLATSTEHGVFSVDTVATTPASRRFVTGLTITAADVRRAAGAELPAAQANFSQALGERISQPPELGSGAIAAADSMFGMLGQIAAHVDPVMCPHGIHAGHFCNGCGAVVHAGGPTPVRWMDGVDTNTGRPIRLGFLGRWLGNRRAKRELVNAEIADAQDRSDRMQGDPL